MAWGKLLDKVEYSSGKFKHSWFHMPEFRWKCFLRLFSRLPRHGIGFQHSKSQNADEKEQELKNVLKLWMVEILNVPSAYIFLNIVLILILRVRERSCSFRLLHMLRQPISWCSKCELPASRRCITLIGRGQNSSRLLHKSSSWRADI